MVVLLLVFFINGYLGYNFNVPFHQKNNSKDPNIISVLTLNATTEKDTLEEIQVDSIASLIERKTPTIFALQGIAYGVLKKLPKKLKTRYDVVCSKIFNKDIRMNKDEYMPVFYNINSLENVENIAITSGIISKSCMASFYHKKTKKYLSIFNVDFFSTENKIVKKQISDILKFRTESKFNQTPVFILGTINTGIYNLRELYDEEYYNPIDLYSSNSGSARTTFHNYKTRSDGIQRDYTLLKNANNQFSLVKSEIINSFDTLAFKHYPVYSELKIND